MSYYIVTKYGTGRGVTRRAHRIYSQAFESEALALEALESFDLMHPEYSIKARPEIGSTAYSYEDEEGNHGAISIQSLIGRPLEDETEALSTTYYEFEV